VLSSPEVGIAPANVQHCFVHCFIHLFLNVTVLSGIGPYAEVAFYHNPSKTLLTDVVIFIPRQPPECVSKESLLASAKSGLAVKILSKGKEVPDEPVVDNKLNRQ
jgi:hypothetical protein